ncbi:hypothetical protein [Streptomyces sp. NPDC089799]|uniref:hypothetical protein n=1 Tax=Streptomyces sp. NPDC089799 TaxID=3155066 RepID=UPI003444E4C7
MSTSSASTSASTSACTIRTAPSGVCRTPVGLIRGRIGSGFHPAPHRYRLYLSAGCPRSEQVSRAHALLGLADLVGLIVLDPAAPGPTGPAGPRPTAAGHVAAGHAALSAAYEAADRSWDGTATVPALCDTWSGRVVSNHTPDILHDLAVRIAGRPDLLDRVLGQSQGICSAAYR